MLSQIRLQQGVGLVEVLVAVLLLAVAVLGFSALQLRAVKSTDESLVRTQATSLIRGLSEKMRGNPSVIATYKSALNTTPVSQPTLADCDAVSDNCTAATMAEYDAKYAAYQAAQYGVSLNMATCPSTSGFSKVECVIAAWEGTSAALSDTDTNSCAKTDGTYYTNANCVIVEAY